MQAIQSTIKPEDAGPQVANLYAALQFLIEKDVFVSLPPTELAALKDQLRSEEPSGYFKGAAVTLVQLFQVQSGLGDGLGGVVEDKTADLLNQQLKKYGAFDTGTDFFLRGTVKDANGNPQSGLVVIAYDRDLRRWQELGRAETDPEGRFEIPYRHESFRQAEGVVQPELDLVLKVARRVDGEALEPLHVHEEPRPVPPVATIDIVLPGPSAAEPSEFQRASALIQPLLVGQGAEIPQRFTVAMPPPRYGDLQPWELNADDMNFVVRETGLAPAQVRAWATSARMARELALIAAQPPVMLGPEGLSSEQLRAFGWNVFYGYLRKERAADLDDLLAHDASTWEEWQRRNAESGWVDAEPGRRWFGIVQALERLRRIRLADPIRNASHPFAKVVATAAMDVPTDLITRAIDVIAKHGMAKPEALFEIAPDGANGSSAEAAAVRALVRGIRLLDLTDGDASLMTVLARAIPSEGLDSHGLEPLAKAGREQWARWCAAAAKSEMVDPGATRPWELQARAERMHPGAALVARMDERVLPLSAEDAEQLHVAAKAAPTAVGALLSGQSNESVESVPEGARELVRNLGRYLKLGFTIEAGAQLWANGVKSPGAMTSLGVDVIHGVLGSIAPSAYIEAVVHRAQWILDGSAALVNAAAGSQQMPFGLSQRNQSVSTAVKENLPTLRGLFGDLDECLCRPCESVLGLPAYLADLLTFLKKIPAHTQTAGNALQALRTRRPDITGTLRLGCEDAEREVQQIEIVIKVLESIVGADPGATLATAAYPWTLPYARVEAELRAWLDLVRADRTEWMAQLLGRAGNPSHAAALAAQRLGLDPASWAKVSTPAARDDEVWPAYGFANASATRLIDPASGKEISGTPPQLLARMSVLMNRSGLDFQDLARALQTRFVAGNGALSIAGPDGCKTSEMTVTGLTAQVLDRLHRFVRLWRAMSSVSMPVLDSAIDACSRPATIDFGVVLIRLSRLAALSKHLRLGMDAMLALFRPLHEVLVPEPGPGVGARSFYADLFLSERLAEAQRQQFPRDPTAAGAFGFGAALRARMPALAAAMRCSPQALSRWMFPSSTTTAAPAFLLLDNWDYATLTQLYRRQTLASALALTPAELALMCAMTGGWPLFESTADAFAAAMETLVDALSVHERSTLTVEETAELLLPESDRQGVPRSEGTGPDWANIKAALLGLRATLRDVPREIVGSDPAELLRAKDAALVALGGLIPPRSAQAVVTAIEAGPLVDPARWLALNDALDVPILGISTADGREVRFLAPAQTDALLNWVMEQERLQALHDRIRDVQLQLRLREELSRWSGLSEPVMDMLLMRGLPVETNDTALRVAETALLSSAVGGLMNPQLSDEQAAGTLTLTAWMYRLKRLAWLMAKFEVTEIAPLLDAMRATLINGVAGPQPFSLVTMLAATDSGQGRVRWVEWRGLLAMIWMLRDGIVNTAWLEPLLRSVGAAGTAATAITWSPLAQAWSVSPTELHGLLNAVLPGPFDNTDPWHWWRARQLLEQATGMRIELAQWLRLCDAAPTDEAVALAKVVARSARPSGAEKIEDQLRTQWRDALLARATTVEGRTVEDLHAHYLIDMRMDPCMKTTPTLQAIASVQQFVHRIFFGREPGIGARPGADLTDVRRQWTWMSQYRVWEANRKVFLFPENWLLPELRDDKSECFKGLEAALAQPETTSVEVEQAFSRFLDDVAQVGRIHVLGMFEDIERNQASAATIVRRDLYQVGRTPNQPYRYYWRVSRDFGLPTMEWAPWRLIDLDIQGDHLVPFVQQGDLHIAWPIFERDSSAGSSSTIRLKMAWSRLVALRWNDVEVTRDALELAVPPTDDERTGFAFRAAIQNNSSLVVAYARQTGDALRASAEAKVANDQLTDLTDELKASLRGHWNIMFVAVDSNGAVTETRGVAPGSPTLNDREVGVALSVNVEVWVRLTAGNGKTGYARLATGNHPKYVVDIVFTMGSREVALGLWQPVLWANDYGSPRVSLPQFEVCARLRIHGQGGDIQGQKLTLSATPPDKFRTVDVTLVIDPAAPLSPERLGIASSEVFEAVAEFEPAPSGNGRLGRPRFGPARLPLLAGCSAQMGGYRGGYDTRPILLPSPDPVSPSLEPFLQPYWLGQGYFYTSTDIWLVGAASNASGTGPTNVWHYFDGHDACLIDLHSFLGPARRFEVHAAAHTDALDYRGELARGPLCLAWRGNQPIRFSADGLPRPQAAGDTPQWQAQLAGSRGFDLSMPYGCYSWEVFLHAPLLVAQRLSQQGRHADAEQWLRMIIDPTSGEPGGDATRFLRFRPFRELDAANNVRASLEALAMAKRGLPATGANAVARLVERWRRDAFMPFTVARGRSLAFLWRAVFAYLDNLLAWADDLFRLDTREAINEATQLYVLASQMLGRRPSAVGGPRRVAPVTYDQVESWWDEFANVWLDSNANSSVVATPGVVTPPVGPSALFFCLPVNPKLCGYWDRVQERLLNIRHCRNIDGVQRELPLTEAQIDPEVLVRARAAGLDIGDVVRGLYAPPHAYRFQTLLARALELANEARSLAAGLLSAIEKRDAEQLSQLRSSNELATLERIRQVRILQRDEADEAIRGLLVNRDTAERRFRHLQRLLSGSVVPPARGQTLGDEPMISAPVARDGWGFSTGFGGKLGLIEAELAHIDFLGSAQGWMIAAGISKSLAGVLHTGSAVFESYGNKQAADATKALGTAASAVGDFSDFVSRSEQNHASRETLRASHIRRRDEWSHQANQVLAELRQIDKSITANEIRREIAVRELANQQDQIQESRQIDEFLRSKFTNAELYQWMRGELAALLKSTYRLGLDLARRAEVAAARELGVGALDVIRNDQWNPRRGGLLAPEHLVQDLKRLELMYLDRNRREHEMTKHISLRMLDPLALIDLITQGSCDVSLPEWLFDMDVPGHNLRRLKTVGLSIPSVVGPYAAVNCKLTLMRNITRISGSRGQMYAREGTDDPRFEVRFGGTESVITSTGRDDTGLFETNMRDERYLPFEGAGAISLWRIEFPSDVQQFDRTTISDVVLHLRYTARDAGHDLAEAAKTSLQSRWGVQGTDVLQIMLSMRTEFAAEWARASQAPEADLIFEVDLKALLPYWMQASGMDRADGEAIVAFALRQKETQGAPTLEPIDTPRIQGHELTVRVPNGWAGLKDVLFLFPVRRAG